jgi:hypothetical protein
MDSYTQKPYKNEPKRERYVKKALSEIQTALVCCFKQYPGTEANFQLSRVDTQKNVDRFLNRACAVCGAKTCEVRVINGVACEGIKLSRCARCKQVGLWYCGKKWCVSHNRLHVSILSNSTFVLAANVWTGSVDTGKCVVTRLPSTRTRRRSPQRRRLCRSNDNVREYNY